VPTNLGCAESNLTQSSRPARSCYHSLVDSSTIAIDCDSDNEAIILGSISFRSLSFLNYSKYSRSRSNIISTTMFAFNKKYFYFTLLLFTIEVGIALFVHDSFIRPFIGDVLVVILIYCFVRTFCKIRSTTAAISVLAFAGTIEILQSFNLLKMLGLQSNKIMAVAIGSTFDWKDLLAYAIGTIVILWLENGNKLDRSR
jgi:hypothetical protein